MRRRVVVFAALAMLVLGACPALAADTAVGSNDLIENAQAYDGQKVVYSGEVIGDILGVGDHEWLNVSDGSNAVGVWVASETASEVQVAGRYDRHGDTVRVTGVFHRACPEHGGDFDIHAETVELIERGFPVTHDVQTWKAWLAVLLTLSAAACAVPVLARVGRRRMARE